MLYFEPKLLTFFNGLVPLIRSCGFRFPDLTFLFASWFIRLVHPPGPSSVPPPVVKSEHMVLSFVKYQGAGNDFILIDDRSSGFPDFNQKLVQTLCDRHFGIGADGLILLRQGGIENGKPVDFRMLYFNADGKPGSLCGNGGRCIAAYAERLGIWTGQCLFHASDGWHQAERLPGERIQLHMSPVRQWEHLEDGAWFLDTGSPHYVAFNCELDGLDVDGQGRSIRNKERFREAGVNVNFVGSGIGSTEDPLHMRTYERGVEKETLACGTGATAVALAYALKHNWQGERNVVLRSPGGDLEISFVRTLEAFEQISLIGRADFVFEGTWPVLAP